MGDGQKSGAQKLYTGLVSPSTAARMEAESRAWMVRCPNCGYERSVWETGGVRYRAVGTSYWLRRCPNCGKLTWHKVYRPTGSAAILAPVVPLPDTSPRSRWLLWAVVLGAFAAIIVVFLAVLLFVINAFTQPVATAGDNFMTALKTGDYAQAYALCTPDLQQQLGGVSGMATLAQDHRPAQWNWTSRSLRNGIGLLDGPFTYIDGKAGTAHLTLRQVGSDWKIESFRLNPG
jgi:predicted RNA-binding Zn-ribbon protein involved in translation (DUF1610 family)